MYCQIKLLLSFFLYFLPLYFTKLFHVFFSVNEFTVIIQQLGIGEWVMTKLF